MKKYINKALLLAVMIGFSGGAMADSQRHGRGSKPAQVVQAPSISLDEAVERARAKGHRVLKASTRTKPNGKQVHVLKVRTRKGVVKRIIVR